MYALHSFWALPCIQHVSPINSPAFNTRTGIVFSISNCNGVVSVWFDSSALYSLRPRSQQALIVMTTKVVKKALQCFFLK